MKAAGLFLSARAIDPPERRCDRIRVMIGTGQRGRNMAIRTKLVAGNWKMNGLRQDGAMLAHALKEHAAMAAGTSAATSSSVRRRRCLPRWEASSRERYRARRAGLPFRSQRRLYRRHQRRDAGRSRLRYVIVGHSERRQGHGETDADFVARSTPHGGQVCRDPLRRRDAGAASSWGGINICSSQLAGSIPEVAGAAKLVIAYEPVWAIGTGLTPTTDDITAVHAVIRSRVPAGNFAFSTAARSIRRMPARSSAFPKSTARSSAAPASTPTTFWAISQSCPAR